VSLTYPAPAASDEQPTGPLSLDEIRAQVAALVGDLTSRYIGQLDAPNAHQRRYDAVSAALAGVEDAALPFRNENGETAKRYNHRTETFLCVEMDRLFEGSVQHAAERGEDVHTALSRCLSTVHNFADAASDDVWRAYRKAALR
jgi:hypothetical protein